MMKYHVRIPNMIGAHPILPFGTLTFVDGVSQETLTEGDWKADRAYRKAKAIYGNVSKVEVAQKSAPKPRGRGRASRST